MADANSWGDNDLPAEASWGAGDSEAAPASKPMGLGEFIARNVEIGLGQLVDMAGNAVLGEQAGSYDPEEQQYFQKAENGHPYLAAGIRTAAGAATGAAFPVIRAAQGVGQLTPRIAATAGGRQAIGEIAGGGAIGAGMRAVEDTGNPYAQAMANIATAFVPSPYSLAKTSAKAWLNHVETRANPDRLKSALANAEEIFPGQQTIGQSTNTASLRKFGAGVMKKPGEEAQATQADNYAKGMLAYADTMSPRALTNSAIQDEVANTLQAFDSNLKERASNVYSTGRAKVKALQAVSPASVDMSNLLDTYDKLVAEKTDIFKIAPTNLSPETQQLLEFLKGNTVTSPNGAAGRLKKLKPLGAMDLGKALNELYDAVDAGALTPQMDMAFKRLKSAYQKDIDAAIAGNTINQSLIEMKRTNDLFGRITDKRTQLRNSIVNKTIGLGELRGDPDAALRKISTLNPEAQAYTRRILEAYSPETLNSLRRVALENMVNGELRASHGAGMSRYNIRGMNPKALAESGIFSFSQAQNLAKYQDALNTILNDFPEVASGNTAIMPEAIGRQAMSGNPIFIAGSAAKIIPGTFLDRVFNTPEGRNWLKRGAYDKGPEGTIARRTLALWLQQSREEDDNSVRSHAQ